LEGNEGKDAGFCARVHEDNFLAPTHESRMLYGDSFLVIPRGEINGGALCLKYLVAFVENEHVESQLLKNISWLTPSIKRQRNTFVGAHTTKDRVVSSKAKRASSPNFSRLRILMGRSRPIATFNAVRWSR